MVPPPDAQLIEAEPVRPVALAEPGALELWGREVGPVALAGAAGAAAGVVAVVAARVAREPSRRPPRRGLLRRREKVVGSRSFLVDIHVLGR